MQRHILAAANLKQPWFFHSLIEKYICIARQLSSPDLVLPVTITDFRVDESMLKEMHTSAQYPDITLTTEVDVQRVLKFCVMILEHFFSDLLIMRESVVVEILNLFLDIYLKSSFAIKLECLKFFYRSFKCHDRLPVSFMSLFTQVLHITSAILLNCGARSPHQPTEEELETFDKTLMKLFEVIRVQPIVKGTTSFLPVALEFHNNQQRLRIPFKHFPNSFPGVVRNILENGCDLATTKASDEESLYDYARRASGELWICGLYLKNTCHSTDELRSSRVWTEMVVRLSTELEPTTMFELLNVALKLAENIGPFVVFPSGNYETITSTVFLRQTEQLRRNQPSDSLARNIELIQKMLLIKDASSLDDRTQQQLFDVLVYGLEDLLELKFRPPAGVFQLFYESQKRLKDAETELLILNLVAGLRRDHLCRPVQNKLRLLAENVMKKSVNSLPPPTVHHFLKTTFPELLRNKHISFDDKAVQFLQQFLTKVQYNEALVRILNQLICLSAAQLPASCLICKGSSEGDKKATVTVRNGESVLLEVFKKSVVLEDIDAQLLALDALEKISKHFPEKFVHLTEFVLNAFLQPNPDLLIEFSLKAACLLPVLNQRGTQLEATLSGLLKLTKESLSSSKARPLQLAVLRLIRAFALASEFDLATFLRFFKLILIFLVRDESRVVGEAMLLCEESCLKRRFKPRNMFNWYTQQILEIIVPLFVSLFLQRGIAISNALIHVSKLFEFSGPNIFIYENHPLLLAQLLPFVVKVFF